jgi:hypothetical protein
MYGLKFNIEKCLGVLLLLLKLCYKFTRMVVVGLMSRDEKIEQKNWTI